MKTPVVEVKPPPPLEGKVVAPKTALAPFPLGPEVAVVLEQSRFYPSRIRLKEGQTTRLHFATLNKKPAALIVEAQQIQRWINSGEESQKSVDITRELNSRRMTEVVFEPKVGTYSFHDAISGATGEIVVEP